MDKKYLVSIAISIFVFLTLYLLAYVFLGVITGECLSTRTVWVRNFDTVIIAIISILAGNIFLLIRHRILRKSSD